MGGSSGFGAKMATVFNDLGANVIIAARNEKKLIKVVKQCKNKKNIRYHILDVNIDSDIEKFVSTIKKKYKFLNVILFCCGMNIRSKFNNIDINDFKNVLNTNFISALKFYRKIFPLINSKKIISRVINFTSIFSDKTFEERTSYATSKAALKMLTKNLSLEWVEFNTTVNCISPGPFLTEINKPVLKNKKNYDAFCQKIPLKRFGNINEIISSVLYLSSDYSSYVTGSEVIIDGGWTVK